ncbi:MULTISPECIES: hypothetical protein [unclassified Sinorhizobium]|uniref:hypothetical protein n=1 Tax=unclassified Sinorhizobium TaxID=2613772 RepID=UPI0035260837
MILKIITRDSEVETEDTGTFADGMFEHIRPEKLRRDGRYRSSHERDYGVGRKVTELPVGFA